MKNKKAIPWSLAFILTFLLSQDYLFFEWEGTPAFLGFPKWIAWFVFVHILFITVFYFFARKYWNK